jgi:type II secretory pathway component PulJ
MITGMKFAPVSTPIDTAAAPEFPCVQRQRQRGFTVVEVTMATFVMLFAIATSITVLQSGFRVLDTTRKTTLSSQIMQSEMERIRMLSWGNMVAMEADTAYRETNNLPPPEVDLDEIFPGNTTTETQLRTYINNTFNTARRVTYVSGKGTTMANIAVTISWIGLDNVPHTRTSSTRYTKDGLYAYYYRVP